MNSMEGLLDMVAANAEASAETDSEYMGEDGLLHCKVCGGKRQTIITPPFEGAKPRTVRCWCNCRTKYDDFREQERLDDIGRARQICFKNFTDFAGWTFDKADDRQQELMTAAKGYADQFPEFLRNGKGLLFYGDVGTGKSLAAACIANALIDKGYKPKMTSLPIEADNVWAAEDKAEHIRSLCKYDLLIFDDLGVERDTPYMQEMIYKIINSRVAQGGPMIVTSNLTQKELGSPADIGYQRVYSRILQRCLAIHVEGNDRRMEDGWRNKHEMRKQLGIGGGTA